MKKEKNVGFRNKTHEGVDKAIDKAEQMRDSGREKLAQLKERAMIMRDNVDGYIIRNPEKSVLIAAGVGVVVGAVVTAVIMKKKKR